MEVCPYSYFRSCGYFRGPWVSFVTADEFSVRVTKIQRFGSHDLTGYLSVYTYKCKPGKFEPRNSLKLSFKNIRVLGSNFVECESFKLSWHALFETNLNDSIANFVKEAFLLHGTYLWKTLQIITYVFNCLYFTQCVTSFHLSTIFFVTVTVLILFHLTWSGS